MTMLSAPSNDLLEGVWQYGFDELYVAGVELDADQLAPFRGESIDELAMIAWALPDPEYWSRWAADFCPPLEVSDVPGGPRRRPTIPAAFQIDWSLADTLEHTYGSIWRRFPSLPGRVIVPDGYGEEEAIARYVRCWDQATIEPKAAEEITDSTMNGWIYGQHADISRWWSVFNNELSMCEMAIMYGRERFAHRHTKNSDWCVDGEEMFGAIQSEIFWYGMPEHGYTAWTEHAYMLDPVLAARWAQLSATSRQHAEQAMLAPYDLHQEVLRYDERQGGRPWG